MRRALAAALVVPLAGAGLLAAAGPALAAGSITNPGDGTLYSSNTTVAIRASVDSTSQTELRLTPPGGAEQVVDSGAGTVTNSRLTLSYSLDTGSPPVPNGSWRVRLTGGASDEVSFTLRIPPAVPSGVTATAQGYRAVTVSWRKGTEPDLVGWTLYGDDAVAQDGITPSACSGPTCSATVTYDRDGTGTHRYAVVAKRRTAPGSSTTLASARSAEATATLDSPPPPSPTAQPTPEGGGSGPSSPPPGGGGSPSPGGGSAPGGGAPGGGAPGGGAPGGPTPGGSGGPSPSSGGAPPGSGGGGAGGGSAGSGGGSASGGGITTGDAPANAIAQRRAFGLSFSAFAPKLGIPKLPPLPATQPAVAAPLPDGTYRGTLGYKEVVRRERVSTPQAAVERVGQAVTRALDSEQLARSVAGALILLLVAAHLRRWLGDNRGG